MEIASNAGAQAIAQLDANHDGVLDYSELAKAPGLRAGVAKIKNLATAFRGPAPSESQLQNAKISAEEIDARIQHWKEHGAGRITVFCRVFRVNKKAAKRRLPLPAPRSSSCRRPFWARACRRARARPDKTGSAMVSQPSRGGDEPAIGICPGYYRVEITKGNEIPAKYNTATILGVEIAGDSLELGGRRSSWN